MSNSVWNTLNEKNLELQMGIYILDDGDILHVALWNSRTNKFEPLPTNYFQKNPSMLNRDNWYMIDKDGLAQSMNEPKTKDEKTLFQRIFIDVMTSFLPKTSANNLRDYAREDQWGFDAIGQLLNIKQQHTQKAQTQINDPKSAINKVAEVLEEAPKIENIGTNEQVPRAEKEMAKDVKTRVERSALRNVQNFLEKIQPGLSESIDSKAFHDLLKNDLNLFNQAAKLAYSMKRHGYGPQEEEIVNQLDQFLNQKAELGAIASLKLTPDERRDLLKNYFRQQPSVTKGKIPTASDFGFMNPSKNSLSYLMNQNMSMDSMNQLIAAGYKVVFNPNLLNLKGATRYAKQIKGTLAPVMDYDGDGMEDFYIYDKSGKIAVINGYRLKRDDKAVLKRMFYTHYDAKERKAMGGFKGWLNTVLFQVGPYNWKGERTVRVTKKNWEMLQALHNMGYLKKKPESLLPKTKKSFSSTLKTHILDSIKSALEQTFDTTAKCTWYLPINYVRDILYKIIAGSEMYKIASNRGVLQSLVSTISNYNLQKQKQNSKNQLFKLLSQWCSKDTQAKAELESTLQLIITDYIPTIHIIGVGLLLGNTNFLEFMDQTKIDDASLNREGPGGKSRVYLMEQRSVWANQIKPAAQNLFESYFPDLNQKSFGELVHFYSQFLQKINISPAAEYTVNTAEYVQFAENNTKDDFTGKYAKYNLTSEDQIDLDYIREKEIHRRPGARAYNADVIAGEEYRKHLDNYAKLPLNLKN